MDKVAILLSSYNGNLYIEEQIESIYNQTYKNFQLYIRDDGSSDEFKQLLRSLQEKYNFILYEGENVGFLRSFLWLLGNVSNADYYSFADQDDIWLPNKLEKAISSLKKKEVFFEKKKFIPMLYHSAYNVINSEGLVIDKFYYSEHEYDFVRSITENHYSGFSMVINNNMRECMLKGSYDMIGYHDWWAAMIAKGFGVSINDEEICALHRSHENNVTKINLMTRIQWLKDNLFNESDIHNRVMEYKKCFEKELDAENKKVLTLFTFDRYDLKKSILKAFYPKRWRPILSSEIIMRILMLIGKI